MNIKEIEERSGLTRANIRYYEQEGLLAPARRENKYRDYSEEDLETLVRQFSPEVMAIEELFFNTNVTTGIGVAQARGVILMTAAKLGVHIFEYTPSQVKQAVVGYGKAEKRQVMDMTKRILHLSAVPKPDDAADAVAIALCHARSHTSRLTRFGL